MIVEASGQSLSGSSAGATLAEGCTIPDGWTQPTGASGESSPVNRVEHATCHQRTLRLGSGVTPYTSSLPQAASGTPMPAAARPWRKRIRRRRRRAQGGAARVQSDGLKLRRGPLMSNDGLRAPHGA